MSRPPSDVLTAFGVKDELEPLSGGRGLCFKAGAIVLRPADDEEEAQWLAEFITALTKTCPPTAYRLPTPIATTENPSSFVKSGWTASSFLPGTPLGIDHVKDTLAVCRAFHADVARLNLTDKPPFLDRLTDRFHIADRVTWGDLDLQDVDVVHRGVLADIQTHLDAFRQLMRPLTHRPAARQLIHGDMAGNILFDTTGHAVAPGIIDQTPFWRPAEYAEAIIVADGLIWNAKGQDLIDELPSSQHHLQLLVRALYYRCVTFAIDSDMAFVVPVLPKAQFASAARAVYEATQAAGNAKKE